MIPTNSSSPRSSRSPSDGGAYAGEIVHEGDLYRDRASYPPAITDYVIYGSTFTDTITGGDGPTVFIGGAGNDTLIGGNFEDTFDLRNVPHNVNQTLYGGAELPPTDA